MNHPGLSRHQVLIHTHKQRLCNMFCCNGKVPSILKVTWLKKKHDKREKNDVIRTLYISFTIIFDSRSHLLHMYL